MEDNPENRGSKISNIEWGLLIGAVLTIDLIQAALDWLFGIGIVVNPFIDVFVGMSLALYFYLRGVKVNLKKVATFAAGFGLEVFGFGLDTLPLWTLDVIAIMVLDKMEKKVPKLPI